MLTELEQRADTEARHAHRELVEAYEAKLSKSEALLAKAVDALALYSCEDGCNECPEFERDRVSCGWTACRTLAELKGETDD